MIIEARNLEDAVEKAVKFKEQGRYDWFRGQAVDLPPTPSLGRLDEAEFENAKKRIQRFFYWVVNTPGLTELRSDPDAIWAIAQHYGIASNFLDFSTDPGVAGYFAATKKESRTQARSCIYCVNTQELRKSWTELREILPHYPDIEFVKLAVPNLWRLEAQHGVFLYCPTNWERACVVDRIVFPASGLPSYPTTTQIYPERKSQLELLLDHYFHVDRFAGSREKIESIFPEALVFEIEPSPGGFEAEFFVRGKLPLRTDWRRKAMMNWLSVKSESFYETATGDIGLRVSLRADPHALRQNVVFAVKRALELNPNLRNRAARWFLLPQQRLQKRLTHALDWLWNGLRLLPYTDQEIADAIGLCFALHRLGFHNQERDDDRVGIANQCLGPTVCVEFSSWDGSGARGFVSRSDLRSAVRPSIQSYMKPRYRAYAKNIEPLLQLCSNPRRLFEFRRLASVFATQICPTQVMRPHRTAGHFLQLGLKVLAYRK